MSKEMISKLNSVRVNAFVFGFAFGVIMALATCSVVLFTQM